MVCGRKPSWYILTFCARVRREVLRKTAKGNPKTCNDETEGDEKYSSTLSLISALDGVDGQRHAPAALLTRMRSSTHCTGSGMGPQVRSGWVQKILPPLIRSPDHVVLSKLMYRLRYSGPRKVLRKTTENIEWPIHHDRQCRIKETQHSFGWCWNLDT